MMTEGEAKAKWCPFARALTIKRSDGAPILGNERSAANRLYTSNGELITSTNCLGSACMAWRATDNEGAPSKPDEPEVATKPAGFCGLAGKP